MYFFALVVERQNLGPSRISYYVQARAITVSASRTLAFLCALKSPRYDLSELLIYRLQGQSRTQKHI